MKVRILPGHLSTYHQKGGSWDEASPDPVSFLVEVSYIPSQGEYVVFNNPNNEGSPLSIGEVATVVATETMPYVFVSRIERV